MQELLWLLLPVAAASGWYAARRSGSKSAASKSPKVLRRPYFKGISYLLNEQPDKAIELLIKALEVDSETIETHMALGHLYRRRGEVDRAIRIHQHLIEGPTLNAEQRSEALLALGQDYMSAGLLDRAENLFQELVDADTYTVHALRQLIEIYEQEKDWGKAIRAARKLEKTTNKPLGGIVAHYYCEQAQRCRQAGELSKALKLLKQALDSHGACVRASLLEGDTLVEKGDYQAAIEAYRRVEEQDSDYLPETIERIHGCFRALGTSRDMMNYLSHVLDHYGGVTATLALAELKRQEKGEHEAEEFIIERLRERPSVRGYHWLLELELLHADGKNKEYLLILKDLTTKLLEGRPAYKCQRCGFAGKSLHWQCPGCKQWNTIKPIHGIEGE